MIDDVDRAPIPIVQDPGFITFSLVVYILSASLSLLVFLYGLIIVALDPRVWNSHIVRVIVIVQLMNCLRFILRILGVALTIRVEYGCRAMLFLNAFFTTLPVNLSVYCVVYLQIIIIHRVRPQKRWPKAVPLTFALLITAVPAATYLYIPQERAGLDSFCKIPKVFNHTTFVFFNITVGLWEYLTGLIGIISVTVIGVYIFRAQRAPQSLLRTSTYSYDPSRTVIQQSQTNILYRTLLSIIWYPITPILALWFNLTLFTISYHTRRTYTWLEYINTILLGLQSILLGTGLLVNPTVQRAFEQKIWKRCVQSVGKAGASRIALSTGGNTEQGLPPLHFSSALSLDDTLGDSIYEI